MINLFVFADKKRIEQLCLKYSIASLKLFGSQARGDATSTSDVDLLVRFSKPVGLFHLLETEYDLKKILGKDVDLVTEGGLSKYIKPYIQEDLVTLYEDS